MKNLTAVKDRNGHTLSMKSYGSGPNIFLMLHGIPGSSHSWEPAAQLLESRGARVLVPDLLGFGTSSRPTNISELWIDSQAASLANAIDSLGISRLHLVGHDYGGPISVTLYGLMPHKIASMTLLATNTFTDTPIPPPLAMIKLPVIGRLWERLIFSRASLTMMIKKGVGRKATPTDPAAALGDEQQTRAIAAIFGFALRDLRARYKDVEARLAQIEVPTQILWGTKDPFFKFEQGKRTAESIPGAKLIALEGAGHFLPEECPAEIATVLSSLLK